MLIMAADGLVAKDLKKERVKVTTNVDMKLFVLRHDVLYSKCEYSQFAKTCRNQIEKLVRWKKGKREARYERFY
ncbi:hypothetical protein LINGRAHAP2_LOCUS11724 [Linum grandiflorum]